MAARFPAVKGWSLALALALGIVADVSASDPASGIYNEGRLPSGEPLTGVREGHGIVSGAAAACVNCHRSSGMGQVEGDRPVPPVAGSYLFAKRGAQGFATMDPHVSKRFNQAHEPYTDATLMRAIRDGVNSEGRPMSVLMPRYALADPELRAMVAYLRQLSASWSPGVTQSQIGLATVITPEVGAARRKAFLDTLRTIVRQKNASTVVADGNRTRHHMATAAEIIHGTERTWDLQVWELQGPPETWTAQLSERYREHPVFALVSGLSDSSWQPVQDFCERERVPCWFPSVSASGANPGTYAFYFSAGVRLEAELLARELSQTMPSSEGMHAKRVLQICRDGGVGCIAARALGDSLAATGVETQVRTLAVDGAGPGALETIVREIAPEDVVVFWLRGTDLAELAAIDPPATENYFSGSLAGADGAAVPPRWRSRAHLLYPYELPERREKNLENFHAWLSLQKLDLVDEPMQSEIFFSMSFLGDTLSDMLDNLYRDYLIERAEQMLSRRESAKSEQETRDRLALGREGDLLRRRGPMTIEESARVPVLKRSDAAPTSQGTTLYAHLGLGVGQRFASKSGYIVGFAGEDGRELRAETALVTP